VHCLACGTRFYDKLNQPIVLPELRNGFFDPETIFKAAFVRAPRKAAGGGQAAKMTSPQGKGDGG